MTVVKRFLMAGSILLIALILVIPFLFKRKGEPGIVGAYTWESPVMHKQFLSCIDSLSLYHNVDVLYVMDYAKVEAPELIHRTSVLTRDRALDTINGRYLIFNVNLADNQCVVHQSDRIRFDWLDLVHELRTMSYVLNSYSLFGNSDEFLFGSARTLLDYYTTLQKAGAYDTVFCPNTVLPAVYDTTGIDSIQRLKYMANGHYREKDTSVAFNETDTVQLEYFYMQSIWAGRELPEVLTSGCLNVRAFSHSDHKQFLHLKRP
ncbi:MAG: hypothetical protein H6608_07475 [Flavobacteriales bacterium]|nr:hypothetical protein [Flavobacteriales bacterium]